MTVPTFGEIREALATTIKNGVTSEINEYARVPDVTQVPAVVVKPLSAKYIVNMSEDATFEFQILVLCGRSDTDAGQQDLDAFVSHYGPDSIPHALRSNPDIGLDGVDVTCYAMDGYGGEWSAAKVPHVGAILKVRVEADP
jgi:hypothetical protein